MSVYSVTTAYDIISLRFLLALESHELAKILGVESSTILKAEKHVGEIKLSYANALIGACLFAPHANYVLRKYQLINTKKHVNFLKKLTVDGSLPYNRVPKACCEEPNLELYSMKNQRGTPKNKYKLYSCCNSCGKKSHATDIMLRRYLLTNRHTFFVYNAKSYLINEWIKTNKPLLAKAPAEPIMTELPIKTPDDLIKFRFLACLSQHQLACRLGVSMTTIEKMELHRTPITTFYQYALANVYHKTSENFIGFNDRFQALNSRKAVDTWASISDPTHMIPKANRPTCQKCGSQEMDVTRYKGRESTFTCSCNICNSTENITDSLFVARYYHLKNGKDFDILDPKWFHPQ